MNWMVDELKNLRQTISALEAELAGAKAECERLRADLSHRWDLLHDAAAYVPPGSILYKMISNDLDNGEVPSDKKEPTP